MRLKIFLAFLIVLGLAAFWWFTNYRGGSIKQRTFSQIAEFTVDGNAEVLQATPDGNLIVHTNNDRNSIDIVDITNPAEPVRIRRIDMPGEPTSVALSPDGQWAIAVVYAHKPKPGKKAPDPRLPGILALIDIRNPATAEAVTMIGIGHHPDSVAVTNSGKELVAIVAIENEPVVVTDGKVIEHDEPGHEADISAAGFIQTITIYPANPGNYKVATLTLSKGLLQDSGMFFSNDPQPEYVSLSPDRSMAAISLQENNGIVLIDPHTPSITHAFALGKADNRPADLIDDGNPDLGQIYPADATSQPYAGARFPDSIAFTSDGQYLLTANEGEMALTGGRGLSIWTINGEFVWDDRGELEKMAAQNGLYPDGRSDNKGIELEGVITARFGEREFALTVAERGSFLAIYDITDPRAPIFIDMLPAGREPETVVAIPQRGLVVVASEKSGTLTLFEYTQNN